MNKYVFKYLGCLFFSYFSFAQVGIGTKNPAPSAALDVTSTTKGFLPPRLTTAQRDAITSPAHGLTIYNTSANCLQLWNGSGWFNLCTKTIDPFISSLTCASVVYSPLPVVRGLEYAGTATVPYTIGNGGAYAAGTPIASTGVTGLTATLVAGTLNNGNGNLTYTISGVPDPNTAGSAIFSISFGTASCNITVPITNCVSNVTVINDLPSPTTPKIWMDRNLGAYRVANSSTDIMAYGDLYQWGRQRDGHECRYSDVTSTTSSTPSVGAPNTNKFIAAGTVYWYQGAIDRATFWNATGTGINEVCPTGYRVPTIAEWQAEAALWNPTTAAAAAFNHLKLPMGGSRGSITGDLINVGSRGRYYSSTVSSGARTLEFTSDTLDTNANLNNNVGASIRCVKK